MFRTLTGRGLTVVSALLITLGPAVSAAAGPTRPPDPVPDRVVAVHSAWTDPGAVVDSMTPRSDGRFRILAHGATHATGSFAGDSTYRMTLVFDPTTGDAVGSNTETWTASIAGRGGGHLTFAEHVHQSGDGAVRVTGVVTGGDGVFAGATGLAVWTGAFGPSGTGPGQGTSTMVLGLAAPGTAPVATATVVVPYRIVELHGRWRDPGPVIDATAPRNDGRVAVDMHGVTHATGAFAGDSTYQLRVAFDPATNEAIGSATESYAATVDRGSGHVTFAEHVHVAGDGATRVTGVVVGGDGVFAGAVGLAIWTGSETDASTRASGGTSTMLLGLTR